MAIGRITGQMLSANLARSGTDLAFETNLLVLDVTNSRIGIGTASPATTLHVSATDALRLPSGNTAQRPGSPANGDIRYNSTTAAVEGYAGGWLKMTGGTSLADADSDTQIEVERSTDEDAMHFQTDGVDRAHIRSNGNIELNNLQIANMTVSTLATNGDLTLTPNGTGKVIVTDGTTLQTNTADINGGAIDGAIIGANSAAAGTFTTLNTSSNAVIGGDLTVNGTTTTVSTTNTTIADNIIELNSGISQSLNDSGLIIERGSTGNNAAILWDESADKFTMGTTTATAADKSGGITVALSTLVANLEATTATLGGSDIISTDNTKTLTNKTIDANGTGNAISNIDIGNMTAAVVVLESEGIASNDNDTTLPTSASVKDYVDTQDAAIAGDTLTFTNKTIDANGTGNSITNLDSGNLLSGFLKDEDDMTSNSATSVASQQSIKAYVDAQDAAIASDTLTFTNKTIDANGTGNAISNIDSGNFLSGFLKDEDDLNSDSATSVASQQSIKAYVDAQVTAQDLDFACDDSTTLSIDLDSESLQFSGGTGITTAGTGNTVTVAIDGTVATLTGSQTLTNKTLTSPVLNTGVSGTAVKDEDNMASDSATHLATQQSIKAYVDAEVGAVSTTSITQGNTSAAVTDTGSDGAFTVTADGNTELVVNDTSATFSGNVIVSGDFTVNGTTTTIDSTTLTVEDPMITLAKNNSGGDANTFDQGLFFNRGSLANVSFLWDESTDQFAAAVTSGEDGTTAGNVTIDSYAAMRMGVTTVSDLETGSISAADGTAAATIANSTGVVTVPSAVLTTADINGGTVDGATIGGASAGAGTFTTLIAANTQTGTVKANDGTAAITVADTTGAVKVTTAFEVDGAGFIFNESSASVDARFESNGHAHALFIDGSEDHVGIKTATPAYDLDVSGSTDAVKLPNGTTAQRPTGATGIIRFNTTTGKYEGCTDGSTYVDFAIAGSAPTFSKVSATGDGSTTTFTGFFGSAPENANNVFVYIDNVFQEPTENYSVSGTNITFTSAPHSAARIFAITGADGTSLVTGGVARSETSSTNFTSSATNIFTFNGTSYRSAEIFVQFTDTANTEYAAMKGVVIHNGTTAFITVHGITNTGSSDLGTLTATYNSGTIEVKAVSTGGVTSGKVQYSLSAV